MRINLKLSHKGLILVALPLACELVFVTMLGLLLHKAEHEIWRENHSKDVISESNAILKNIVDTGVALYVYGSWGSQTALEKYQELTKNIPEQLDSLKIMLQDSPNQVEAINKLQKITNKTTLLLNQCAQIVTDSRNAKDVDREALETLLSELTSELRVFVKEQEKAEAVDPQDEARSRQLVIQCLIVGVALNIVLAISLAWYFNRGTTRRLKVLMDNTTRLSKGQSLHEKINGQDEIAHLDHVFHNMAEELAETARKKQELVSMVSHDLRTPLTSIQASLTLLSEGVLGTLIPRVQTEIVTAERNTTRLINLINDLLDIEKMEAGQLSVNCQLIAVYPLFKKALEIVEPFAQKHDVNVIAQETDVSIYADSERIMQVLVNLLSNAIKFSPEDSTVKLTATSVKNMVEIQVIDEGRGVPSDFQESIFERFQQVAVTDASEKRGTGLGLAICKSLIDLHGGDLGVRSNNGQGSIFWFRIPVTKTEPKVTEYSQEADKATHPKHRESTKAERQYIRKT